MSAFNCLFSRRFQNLLSFELFVCVVVLFSMEQRLEYCESVGVSDQLIGGGEERLGARPVPYYVRQAKVR